MDGVRKERRKGGKQLLPKQIFKLVLMRTNKITRTFLQFLYKKMRENVISESVYASIKNHDF